MARRTQQPVQEPPPQPQEEPERIVPTGFEEAENDMGYAKVGIYGGPGSGKTLTALRICYRLVGDNFGVIDTERGCGPYSVKKGEASRPEDDKYRFVVAHTKDVDTARSALANAVKAGLGAIIVDQCSHLWDAAQEKFIAIEHQKRSKVWQQIETNGKIPFTAWGKIKRPYKKFIAEAIDAPLHVFLLGRLGIDYDLAGGAPVKTGESFRAEKDTPYEPHMLIKMEFDKLKKKWWAYVEKDRTGTLQGALFENPDGSVLDPMIASLGIAHQPLPQGVEDNDEMRVEDMGPTPTQRKLIHVLGGKGGKSNEEIEAYIGKLTTEQAGKVINRLTLKDYTVFDDEDP